MVVGVGGKGREGEGGGGRGERGNISEVPDCTQLYTEMLMVHVHLIRQSISMFTLFKFKIIHLNYQL